MTWFFNIWLVFSSCIPFINMLCFIKTVYELCGCVTETLDEEEGVRTPPPSPVDRSQSEGTWYCHHSSLTLLIVYILYIDCNHVVLLHLNIEIWFQHLCTRQVMFYTFILLRKYVIPGTNALKLNTGFLWQKSFPLFRTFLSLFLKEIPQFVKSTFSIC